MGSSGEVDEMNNIYRPMPVDRTLKALESIADSKGLKLEDVDGYVRLCQFLTDIETSEAPIEWMSKTDTFLVLKRLIAHVAPGWVGHEWEFHAKCQPKEVSQ